MKQIHFNKEYHKREVSDNILTSKLKRTQTRQILNVGTEGEVRQSCGNENYY